MERWVPFVNDVIPLMGSWGLGLLGRLVRGTCREKVCILFGFSWVWVSGGLMNVVTSGYLAFVLLCCCYSSDDAWRRPLDQSDMSCK